MRQLPGDKINLHYSSIKVHQNYNPQTYSLVQKKIWKMKVSVAVALIFAVSSAAGLKVNSLHPDLRLVVPSKELGNGPEYETHHKSG
jgi:hypothetical protein